MRVTRGLGLVPVAALAWATAAVTTLVPPLAPWVAGGLWAATVVAALLVVRLARRQPGLSSDGASAAGGAAAARTASVSVRPQTAATAVTWGRQRFRMPRALARRCLVVVVLACAAAAVGASHILWAQPARTALSELALDGGRAVDVHASVVGKVERRTDGSLAFDARVTSLATGAVSHAVNAEITVRVSPDDVDTLAPLDIGSVVAVRGTAQPAYPGERAVLVVWASRGVEVLRAPEGVAAVGAALRQGLVRAVDGLPGAGAGLVPGLAVGDTSAVSEALDAAMKESSLSHLTAVSGANCALVVGIAFGAAALLGAGRGARVTAGLGALAGFVVLVSPEPSVVRAATMAAIAMLAVLLGRTGAGAALLSLAVTVLLAVDPWLAGSLGFALSVSATGSLLLFARPLATGLTRFMPQALALALAVPLAAQLACGPLLILIQPTVPLYGVVANLLAGPAAPAATVLGLAACLSAPIGWLQSGLATLAWIPASWIAGTASTISALPADQLPWLEGLPGAAALGVVGIAVGLVIALPRGGARPRRRVRAVSAGIVALVTGVTLGVSALTSVAGRWTLPGEWAVLACDVGQGDAVLLRSAGVVALVDTGPDPEPLTACLARAGIDRVDLLVLTHFDLDHVGGAAALLGRVGLVLHGPPDAAGRALVKELASAGARTAAASTGMSGALGDARWRVLWPHPDSRAYPAGNDASVVLDIRGGGIPPTVLLGDLSASPQRALAASGLLSAPYAIAKVAHHGSADQDAALYALIRPAVAVVTVGAENDYGHPRDEALALLIDAGAQVARTDRDGAVALWTGEAGGVSVWRDRGG